MYNFSKMKFKCYSIISRSEQDLCFLKASSFGKHFLCCTERDIRYSHRSRDALRSTCLQITLHILRNSGDTGQSLTFPSNLGTEVLLDMGQTLLTRPGVAGSSPLDASTLFAVAVAPGAAAITVSNGLFLSILRVPGIRNFLVSIVSNLENNITSSNFSFLTKPTNARA